MRSKTSYFNKTIYVKNLTHFWPIWAVYLIFCLYRLPLKLFIGLTERYLGSGMDLVTYKNQQLILIILDAMNPATLFFFALITATAVFSYLYTARNANMIHAFPVCRKSLFTSNCLSGLTMLILPQLISFLGAIFVCFLKQMTHLEYLLYWLITTVAITFFAFAFAVFTAMVTGHLAAVPILYLILNFLYVGIHFVISSILYVITYGYTQVAFQPPASFLSPLFYLTNRFFHSSLERSVEIYGDILKNSPGIAGLYTLAGILLLIFSLLLYEKRQLETASDVISVPFFKPILRWTVAFCGATGVSVFGISFFQSKLELSGKGFLPLLLFIIPAGIVIFFLTEMLLCKEFRVFRKKRLLECGIYSALVLVFILCLGMDVFKIESRIPSKNHIDSIYLYGFYPIDVDEKDFDKVLDLHQKIIDSKEEYRDYFSRYGDELLYSFVKIRYTLKNGSQLMRTYYLPTEEYYLNQQDSPINQLLSLGHEPDYYLRYHFSDNYGALTFVSGSIDFCGDNGTFESVTVNQADCSQLYEAFKKDIIEGNYHIYDSNLYNLHGDEIYSNTLFLSYSVPEGTTYVDYDGRHRILTPKIIQNTAINLTSDCVNTIKALKELGLVTEERQLITEENYDKLYNDVYQEMNFIE